MKAHINRISGSVGRRKITPEGGAPYYVVEEMADNPVVEGTIVEKVMLDEFLAASGTTAGSGTAFTLAQDGFSLFDGALVRMKLNRDMVAGATLNVAGTGAKAIVDGKNEATSGGIKAGIWVDLIYNGTAYVLQQGHWDTYVVGMYTGDGTYNGRIIPLPFTPSALLVEISYAQRSYDSKPSSSYGGLALLNYPLQALSNSSYVDRVVIVNNGFNVAPTTNFGYNQIGKNYYYIAFR